MLKKYMRFATMICVFTLVMFGLMYLNVYRPDHIFFSQTRAWMADIMRVAMAIVMLSFMQGMYGSQCANIAVLLSAAAVFCVALWLVRSQRTVDQVS